MLPLVKVFGMLIKTLTRPIMVHVKRYIKAKNHEHLRGFFCRIGRFENRVEQFLNRRILGIKSDSSLFATPLADETAVERGIDYFFELFVYTLVISVATTEMIRSTRDSNKKKEEDAAFVKKVDAEIVEAKRQSAAALARIAEQELEFKKLMNRIETVERLKQTVN